MAPLHVGLVYGGQSSEHDISILSARNVYAALDRARFRVTPLFIARDGRWYAEADGATHLDGSAPEPAGASATRFVPHAGAATVTHGGDALGVDVLFPMLHGQNGEDGRVQGFLQTLGLPFVGPAVLASAACMDKEVTKRLLRDAGLPVVPFAVVRRGETPAYDALAADLGPTLFVKPAGSGSSVGVTRVTDAGGLADALSEAFRYDHKVLVETAVATADGRPAREVECAVLGNDDDVRPSVLGEIVSTATFYDYEAKYLDPDAARMQVPADLPADVSDRTRAMAAAAYRALGCEGLARVDFFVGDDGAAQINEINTIPGFTARSMYPVMWEATGLPLPRLLDTLLDLALARHARDGALSTTR